MQVRDLTIDRVREYIALRRNQGAAEDTTRWELVTLNLVLKVKSEERPLKEHQNREAAKLQENGSQDP